MGAGLPMGLGADLAAGCELLLVLVGASFHLRQEGVVDLPELPQQI